MILMRATKFPQMTPMRSDPESLDRCLAYVREAELPILRRTQDRLTDAVHSQNSGWRRSAISVLVELIHNDPFLALRVARDTVRPAEENHADVPGSFGEMLALTGLGLHHTYVGSPTVDYDWPPSRDLDNDTVGEIRERMARFGEQMCISARLAAKAAAALNYPSPESVQAMTLMKASADLALALVMPGRLMRHLRLHPEAAFTEAVFSCSGVVADEFRAQMFRELTWPTSLADDQQGTFLSLCDAHANEWRSLFPLTSDALPNGNVIRLR